MNTEQIFNDLLHLSSEFSYFFGLNLILDWDSQTYLPIKGENFRSQQFAFIEEHVSKLYKRKQTSDIVKQLQMYYNDFNEFEKRNIDVFIKSFQKNTKIPTEVLVENKKQESITFHIWQKAKKTNNFKVYAPVLAKNVELKQRIASYIDESQNTFDVFLDQYEPGFSSQKIDHLFSDLKPKVIDIVKKVQESNLFDNLKLTSFKMDKTMQEKMLKKITSYIGFDLNAGRIDQGEHPMTIELGQYDDVRFTVNYNENNYLEALFAGLHEGGHAIHAQNIDKNYAQYPIILFGNSAGIDESQSLFYENIIGRSPYFWKYYLPIFNDQTKQKLKLEDFILTINKVELSKIRIDADELTYILHIILRFEIEKGLLDGSIQINDLPSFWNEKMKKYLNVEIENDSEGILQDIHWATGFYGYFPSYALGKIYNSQILEAMKKEIDFDNLLVNGEIKTITNWLSKNIHKKTGFYDPEEFIQIISKEKVNPNYFLKYIEEKYSTITNL